LGELRLERARINLRQYLTLGYVLPLYEGDPIQVTVNARLYCNYIEGVNSADAVQENRHILALHQRRPDRNGCRGSLGLRHRLLP
jgi:hypothetical protein